MIPLDPETTLDMTRVVRAPREKVFDAWVVPELRRQWWRSKPGALCTLCEIDARQGGRWLGCLESLSEELETANRR